MAADHQVDAIVMGTHGRTGLSRLLLGSVRNPCTAMHHARCSCQGARPSGFAGGNRTRARSRVTFASITKLDAKGA